MDPKITWWNAFVTLNTSILIFTMTFREKLSHSPRLIRGAWVLFGASLLASLLKFFEWTHWHVAGWAGDPVEKAIGGVALTAFLVGFILLGIAAWIAIERR